MQSPLERDIREQLARYLSGESPLQAFQEWLAPIVLTVRQEVDPSAADLVFEIELRLAEYSNGDWTIDELHNFFRPLVSASSTPHPRPLR